MKHARSQRGIVSRPARRAASAAPLLIGVALTGVGVLASAWLAQRPAPTRGEFYSDYEEWIRVDGTRPNAALGAPPILIGLALIAWQVWLAWSGRRISREAAPAPRPAPPPRSRIAPWIAMAGDLWRKSATKPTVH